MIGKTPYGMLDAAQNKLLDSLSNIVNNSAITVPIGTELDLLEAKRAGAAGYEDWCKYWDRQMSICVLGETLTTDSGDNGSRALGTVHEDILQMLVDADSDLLSDTVQDTLIRWMIEYNFPGAKLPEVWRARPANEKEEAEKNQAKAKATKEQDAALRQIVTTSAKFDDDGDAREYIQFMAPDTLDADMLDRLVKARQSFSTLSAIVEETSQTEDPKKKDLTPPDQTSFAEAEDNAQTRLADQLEEFGIAWDEKRVADLQTALTEVSTLEEAAKTVLTRFTKWSVTEFVSTLKLAMSAAAYAGRDAVLVEFDGSQSFVDFDVFDQPFREQIEFFIQKQIRPSRKWTDILKGDHDRAFMIAGAKDRDMLADIQKSIADAIEQGTSLEAFRKDFDQIVKKHGWSYKGERGWRTKTIFETNIRTSYMAGRLKQMRDPAVIKARPFWEYRHGMTRKPKIARDKHLAWNGLILPHDDPFWDTHFPPNGWGCSCGVRTLSAADLKRRGKTGPDDSPASLMETQIDKTTGKLIEQPQGVDQGFDYQPGDLWQRGFVPSLVDTLAARSAFTVDAAQPVVDLMASAKPFRSKALPENKSDTFYVKQFLKAFGLKMGEATRFTDKAGGSLVVSQELFTNAQGNLKSLKRGHGVSALRLAETIKDPDEIWIGVADRAIPANQGGGTERVLDRKFIRTDPETGLLVIFDLFKDAWTGTTAFQPRKKRSVRTDVNQINKRRSGVLVFKRGASGNGRNNDE